MTLTTTYTMDQLSVRPSQIRVDADMVLPNTFGHGEQEAMAALLITLARENGDQWQGFPVQSIGTRVREEHDKIVKGEPGGMLFAFNPHKTYQVGLCELRDLGAIRVESHSVGGDGFDVVYPTEKLLEPIGRFIV